MRAVVVMVLLTLSGCNATVTVDFADHTQWRFPIARLWGLLAVLVAVIVLMHTGFRLVRWYLPNKRSSSD